MVRTIFRRLRIVSSRRLGIVRSRSARIVTSWLRMVNGIGRIGRLVIVITSFLVVLLETL